MKKMTRIAVGALCGVTMAAAAKGLFDIFTRGLMDEALDREEPRVIRKVKSRLTEGFTGEKEAMQKANELSKELAAKPHQRVEIEASDGTKLVGHYFRVEGAKRTLVAMHGWRSCWSWDFSVIEDFWFKNG